MPGNATVGQFVVGDGTLVGQSTAIATPGKAKLLLNGKAFTPQKFTDWHAVQPAKPALILTPARGFTTVSSSAVEGVGTPDLVLAAKGFTTLIPVFAHMAKPQLLLNGKPFGLISNCIVSPGKPALILKGKTFKAGEVILVPTIPININLIPSVPGSLDLVPTTEEYRDLVPTVEVFR